MCIFLSCLPIRFIFVMEKPPVVTRKSLTRLPRTFTLWVLVHTLRYELFSGGRSPSPTSTSTILSKHAGGGAHQWLVGWGVFPRALPAKRDSVTLVWGKKQQMRLVFLSVWLLCISRAWDFRPICSPGAPALQLCVGRCGTRRERSRSCMYSRYATLLFVQKAERTILSFCL